MSTIGGRARKGSQQKQLDEDLRKLHRRGLNDPRVDDLDALLVVARALSDKPTDAAKIEETLTLAIDGYGVGQLRYKVARLWFGVAPETRGMASTARHEKARSQLNESLPDDEEIKLSTFRTHRAPEYYDTLAKRLVELHQKALSGSTDDAASQASSSATLKGDDDETSHVEPEATVKPEHGSTFRRFKTRLVIAATTTLGVGFAVTAWALWPMTRAVSVPPPGSIVNAWTGHASFHVPTGKFPSAGKAGTVGPETQSGVSPEIRGGDIFTACDLSAGVPCNYAQSAPISARRGDTIQFDVRLYNQANVAIPYVKLLAIWSPGKHEKEEIRVEMAIEWPMPPSTESGLVSSVDPINIRLPVAGAYRLDYIPKSTTLTGPVSHLLYHLPDGILNNANALLTKGIGLEDIGPPPSCVQCEIAYTRVVDFQARVE